MRTWQLSKERCLEPTPGSSYWHKLAVLILICHVAFGSAAELVNRYSFTADASDSVGGANGTLVGGAVISGGAVVLNGAGAYVDLPNGLVASRTNVTFEAWVTDNGSGTWARVFDFGFSTAGEGNAATGTNYLFLTPQAGNGFLRAAITIGSSGNEQIIDWSGWRLPVGILTHVVWTIDAGTQLGRMYVNGAVVGENTSVSFTPAMLGYTVNNWLGRSQWSADPFFNGSITEFRIYDGAMTPEEVQQSYNAGPDVCLWDGPVTILGQPTNQTAGELCSATFSVIFAGRPPVSVQWYRNNAPIPGATNRVLYIPVVALTDNGDVVKVALTNTYGGQTRWALSSNAVLTVLPDTNGPALVRAVSLFPSEVLVEFSEGVRPDTATNIANYTITNKVGQLAITGARVGEKNSVIILSTAPQLENQMYTLIVNNVRDMAAAANPIVPNSYINFYAIPFVPANIGIPLTEGELIPVEGGVDLVGSGAGIWSTNDAFMFAWRNYTNDFDLQVRLESLGFASAWTRAGLMARNGLTTNAAFAAAMAAAGPAGCHFQWRPTADAPANMSGLFPVNFPYTWLRLRRTGNVFSGYAGLDGQTWEFLGAATISMPSVVQVGFALTAGATSGSTTARFREFDIGQGTISTNINLPFEPPGPCSRRTPLVITEIMYNPPGSWPGGEDLEFIELWNSGLVTEDLTGHRLEGDISYTFPTGTKIAPGQFLVIARDPDAARTFYGVTCLGPYTGRLANGQGTVRLLNELGGRLLEVKYDTRAPWPAAPNGSGHSLVLRRPSYGENDPRAWAASDRIGGSPGAFDAVGPEPARGVLINEFLAHTDLPLEDYIELFNTTTNPIDLSGAWLSDEPDNPRFRIPDGTVIPARSYLVYTETQLGFALAAAGEQIFLFNSNLTRVLDAVAFGGQANGISSGRYPDGAPRFYELSSRTPGTSNAPPLVRPIVINEIMYHPITESDDDEYIELYNRGTNAVSLAGWQLQEGVRFTFPSDAVIPPGGYVVVAKNATNLMAKYPQLNATNTFGNYSGRLGNSSDRIMLSMPETQVVTNNAGVRLTNVYQVIVNDVTYHDGGRWGKWSDGWGSSLELIDPQADNSLAPNWADSDESTKAPWTYIDVTNILENGQTAAMINQGAYWGPPTRFEFFLQDEGEVLVDNIEFRNNNGPNLLSNGTFDSGTNGWAFEGVVRGSYVQNGVGISGTPALRLVATGRGDTGPNKARTALTGTVLTNAPNTGTIRAAVRWLRGSPYIMFRLRGHWMEVSQRLNVPSNCGTPGLPNSRLVTNAGPAILDVAHTPILPAAGQPVVVTARAIDQDGIGQVQLRFRIDPAASHATIIMRDDGTGGDAIAGDGIYSATISGRASNTLAAFYIYATDTTGVASRFPADAPARECLVRWGESVIAGSIGTYRLWLTSSNVTFWNNRERNANDPIDATFVYGNWRAVYNVGTLYSGSPFHTPSYNGPVGSFACDYEVNFPPDDKFLGSEPFVLTAFDVTSGSFFHNDLSAQVDLTGNWIARKLGQQYNYRRHIHMFVNGLRRGTIYDDAQQPNSEMLDEYFPNDEQGQLRKIEDWFEFADNGVDQGITTATITRYNKTGGEIDTKRYRWNWRPRATRNPDNWTPLTNLIAVVNETNAPDYVNRVRAWMDVPRCLRPIATHHICGDWDSYGYERGKNMYAYKPDGQPWRFLMWDIELALGYKSRSANDSIYVIHDPTLRFLITNWPAFHREYLGAFQEAVDTILVPGVADVLLDERYASFQQHNLPLQSPQTIKNFLAARRAYLQSILPSAVFAVSNPDYQVVTGSNTLVLSGTAPLNVQEILINEIPYPVEWTSITNWRVTVPLSGGTNVLSISARDRYGNIITNATGSVTANYTGTTIAPEGWVVFNEIMYAPPVAGAAFVELFNTHSNYTFDLSGWRVNGLDYTFPAGATIPPRSYLVLAEDPYTYMQTYGLANVPFDRFNGRLDGDGETLTLLRPEPGTTNYIVVDRVRYETVPPWPIITNGASLQLIDAVQDNARVANWAVGTVQTTAPPAYILLLDYTNAWKYMQVSNLDGVSWQAVGYNDAPWPSGQGLLAYENNSEITPLIKTTLNDPRIGTNGMRPGHAYYFRTRVVLTNNLSGYTVTASAYIDDGAVFYLNGSEITRIRMNTGAVSNSTLANALPSGGGGDATSPDTFTIAGELFAPGTNVIAVSVHQYSTNSSDIVFGLKLEANCVGTGPQIPYPCTPGMANSVASNLPPFTPIWLNEVQAENLTGPLDNFNQHDPWLELYNTSPTNFTLAGYYLSDNYTNLARWAFPTGATIAATGFMVVWCDGETNQTSSNVFHTSFRLSPVSGSIVLSRIMNGTTQVVDYLNYSGLPANWSYGDVPDGQPFYRQTMFYFTPNTNNNGASAPVTIFINEWLADNVASLADPADGNYEDWFELYNPGTNAVDLGGYYLTDTLANPTRFRIPANGWYVVPAGGYLLVWADNEPDQNSTNRPDLHVNFALSKGGEAIGLFAPDGTAIDVVTFGPQQTDVSQGRFPDGGANIYSMPPTPRGPNMLPNTAPVLEPISNRVVTIGQTLTFTATAHDDDLPPQTLQFSLGPGAPAGAQINPTTGLFIWTPTIAPATNRITIIVTDNGTPPLSATQSFDVVVAPVPIVTGVALSNGAFQFTWPTFAGQRFQVEYTHDLGSQQWFAIGPVLYGSGAPLTFTYTPEPEIPYRFFRVRVLDP